MYSIGNVEERRYRTNTGSSSKGGALKNGAVPSGDIIVYSVSKSQVQNSMKEAFESAKREKKSKNQYSMGHMNAFATEATERIAGEVGVFLRNVEKAAKRKGGQKKPHQF